MLATNQWRRKRVYVAVDEPTKHLLRLRKSVNRPRSADIVRERSFLELSDKPLTEKPVSSVREGSVVM